MKEYMFIIRGGEDLSQMKSPEEMQKHMQDWQKWMGGLAEAGQFGGGQPLTKEAISLVDNGKKSIDRPLAEGKELISGYIIVKAESLKAAAELANGCPGFEHNCTIEVREIQAMG